MHTIQCDAVIIGSGFGGACAAYMLTRAGYRTIVIERGQHVARDSRDWDAREILVDMRYAGQKPICVDQYGKTGQFHQINEVVGGGSIFFGGACLRLRENDFGAWPITYRELERHYGHAERLLEIHGQSGTDSFEPPRSEEYPFEPASLTPTAQRISKAANKLGLKPFAMPMAINYHNDQRTLCESCTTCDGFPCKLGAKNDVVVTAFKKCDTSRLNVLTGHLALRLVEQNRRIAKLECLDTVKGEKVEIQAKVFVASAGALETPAIFLRSGLDRLDVSGALGRNLMRHCNAIVGCWFPFKINLGANNYKQLCFTDYYEDLRGLSGSSVGVIQDMLMPPPDGSRHKAPRGFKRLSAFFNPYIQCLLCVAEDKPQLENRVFLDSASDSSGVLGLRVKHEYCVEDIERRNYLVKRAKQILKKSGGWICITQRIDSFSHAVGTMRFGSEPKAAVLDTFCRFFPMDNLYVADGSFMPNSGGVNPSLTIAANSLRVAEHIIERTDLMKDP